MSLEDEPAALLGLIGAMLFVAYAYLGAWLFIVPSVVGALWMAWWAAGRLVEQWRAPRELERIAHERDRAVANMIALRQQAVREMIEIARDDVIDGTASEVERR